MNEKTQVKVLPLEEAVKLAAEENFSRDRRMGLSPRRSEMPVYLEEARELLLNTGENYLPEYSGHSHIKLEGWVGPLDKEWFGVCK